MEGGSGKERREDRTKRVTIGVRWRKLRREREEIRKIRRV